VAQAAPGRYSRKAIRRSFVRRRFRPRPYSPRPRLRLASHRPMLRLAERPDRPRLPSRLLRRAWGHRSRFGADPGRQSPHPFQAPRCALNNRWRGNDPTCVGSYDRPYWRPYGPYYGDGHGPWNRPTPGDYGRRRPPESATTRAAMELLLSCLKSFAQKKSPAVSSGAMRRSTCMRTRETSSG
jgi:hypothetical protein